MSVLVGFLTEKGVQIGGKPVPEIVRELKYIQHHSDIDQALSDVIQALTDHYEREVGR